METNIETRLRFQVEKLGYRFKNVDLLEKALTHSLGKDEVNLDFPVKNRTNQRLCVVGETVLKLVVSGYVILCSESLAHNQGHWTVRRDALREVIKQTQVGKNLFETPERPELVRIQDANWKNSSFVIPFDKFVKGIFGAVFLDSGGVSGDGVANCLRLFVKLWKPFLGPNEEKRNSLEDLFPSPEGETKLFWLAEGLLNPNYIAKLLKTLNISAFRNTDILYEAIIHKSFYGNGSTVTTRKPDYERLEFLGDAVLDVVLAEYYWKHNPEHSAYYLSKIVSLQAEGDVQKSVADKLDLMSFVQIKINSDIWKKSGDIVESIIAAIYVDKGGTSAKRFILEHWRLDEKKIPFSITDLQCQLNYKFRNEETLTKALTHTTFHSEHNLRQEQKKKFTEYKFLGKAVLKLLCTEYAFRTSKLSARPGAIDALQNYLLGQTVMEQIATYLELDSLVQIHPQLKSGTTPFKRFDWFVFPVFGALHKELQNNAEGGNIIRESFYRLWNPYLKTVPKRTFTDCFAPTPTEETVVLRTILGFGCIVKDAKLQLEKSLGHKFENFNFVEQALMSRACRTLSNNPSVGDSDRFGVIAVYALEYFATITVNNVEVSEKRIQETVTKIINAARNVFDMKMLFKYYAVPEGLSKKFKKLEIIISKSVLGAIYVDMCKNNSHVANAPWKSYLTTLLNRETIRIKEEADLRQQQAKIKFRGESKNVNSPSSKLPKSNSSKKKTAAVLPTRKCIPETLKPAQRVTTSNDHAESKLTQYDGYELQTIRVKSKHNPLPTATRPDTTLPTRKTFSTKPLSDDEYFAREMSIIHNEPDHDDRNFQTGVLYAKMEQRRKLRESKLGENVSAREPEPPRKPLKRDKIKPETSQTVPYTSPLVVTVPSLSTSLAESISSRRALEERAVNVVGRLYISVTDPEMRKHLDESIISKLSRFKSYGPFEWAHYTDEELQDIVERWSHLQATIDALKSLARQGAAEQNVKTYNSEISPKPTRISSTTTQSSYNSSYSSSSPPTFSKSPETVTERIIYPASSWTAEAKRESEPVRFTASSNYRYCSNSSRTLHRRKISARETSRQNYQSQKRAPTSSSAFQNEEVILRDKSQLTRAAAKVEGSAKDPNEPTTLGLVGAAIFWTCLIVYLYKKFIL